MLVNPNGHPNVPHHTHFLDFPRRSMLLRMNDQLIEWLSTNVLASRAMFNAAFILPLLVLPLPIRVQMMLTIVSSTWIQWWGIPSIQRTQVQADKKRDALAEANYAAQTSTAHVLDQLYNELHDAKIELQNVRGQVELAAQQIMYRRHDTPCMYQRYDTP